MIREVRGYGGSGGRPAPMELLLDGDFVSTAVDSRLTRRALGSSESRTLGASLQSEEEEAGLIKLTEILSLSSSSCMRSFLSWASCKFSMT